MKSHGLLRRRRRGPKNSPGAQRAEERFAKREVLPGDNYSSPVTTIRIPHFRACG
jgi:hypothetical protein